MRSPLNRLSLDSRYLLFIVSLGAALILGCMMSRIQKDPTADLPRVSQMKLEFAASPDEVDYLKNVAWNEEGTARARRLICWDFVYPFAYALLLALACTFAAQGPFRRGRLAPALGNLLAWGSLLAGVADIGANAAMLRLLQQKSASGAALATAKTFAYLQFSLIGLALVYVLAAMLLSLLGQSADHAGEAA